MTSDTDADSYVLFAERVSLIAITNALLSVRGLLFIPIITKELGAADYGIWTQLIVFVTLASGIANMGLGSGITRFLSHKENQGELREGFYSCLFLVTGTSLVAMVLGQVVISHLLNLESEISKIIGLSLWLIPLTSYYALSSSYLRARHMMKKYSIFTLIKGYGEVALVFIFIQLGLGLVGAFQGTILITSAVSFAIIVMIIKEIGLSIPNFQQSREYLSYSLPVVASKLSLWILSFSDRYIIGFFLTNAAVGIYSAAYGIGHAVNFLLGPLTTVLNPTIFKLWERGERKKALKFVTRSIKFFLILALPAGFGISYLAETVLEMISTEEIALAGKTVTPIVAASIIIYGASVLVSRIFPLNKDTRTLGVIWTIASISNIVANLILVPLMGIIGAAFGTLLSYTLALICMFLFGKKHGLPELPAVSILKCLAACGIMTLVVHLVTNQLAEPFIILITAVPLGILVYFILIWTLKTLDEKEIGMMKHIIRGRI